MKQAFVHEGVTYTLRSPTVFDEGMRGSIMITVGDLIVKGMALETYDEIPHTVDRLAAYFVRWLMVTNIEGNSPLADIDIYNGVRYEDFEIWRTLILDNHQELASKWSNAYEGVTLKTDSPLSSEKDDNG